MRTTRHANEPLLPGEDLEDRGIVTFGPKSTKSVNRSTVICVGIAALCVSICSVYFVGYVLLHNQVINNPLNEKKSVDGFGSPQEWWHSGVVYQIYPRSFMDSNGDGIGDLNGVASRLDYIKGLGVAALWLSPIFPSPMADFGYDISDYAGIAREYGTMADFEALLAGAHQRNLKVILDLVPNHTSNKHPWFLESMKSKENEYADWYVWHDPAPDGGPPNNWPSEFGGAAWEFVEERGQYYYHKFLKEQPDLNFRNPVVRKAIADVMRFWLSKGVDGFRTDALPHLLECEDFRDEPLNPNWHEGDADKDRTLHVCTANVDGLHNIVKEMRGVLNEFQPERLFIAETMVDIDTLIKYYGSGDDEAQMPFNFWLIFSDFNPKDIAKLATEYFKKLPTGVMGNWVLGNHDQHRVATRVSQQRARLANVLLLTLRGTPTTYYGEEIGMHNVDIPDDRIRDPAALRQPKELWKTVGRDPERTPMQWSGEKSAGFSTADDTWLPIADDYTSRNVALQNGDPNSDLSLYRELVSIRNIEDAFQEGSFTLLLATDDVLAYERSADNRRFQIVLNFSNQEQVAEVPQVDQRSDASPSGTIVVGTSFYRRGEEVRMSSVTLQAAEAVVVRIHNN